ncbi:MAG: hypothetical protein ACYC7A_18020 [Thermoanaerobaculia bacterium]
MWAILLVSLLAMQAHELEPTGAPRLVAFGIQYEEKEAAELVKQEWIGLFYDSERLGPVRLVLGEKTTGHFDEPVYDLETEPKGAMVALPAGVVKAGPIVKAQIVEAEGFFPWRRKVVDIVFRGRAYTIRAVGFDETAKQQRIILSDGEREQVLFDAQFVDEPPIDVFWAGDLDRDGKLDLVTNLSPKYSVWHVKLWLSSKAGEGELVGLAAAEMTYGC